MGKIDFKLYKSQNAFLSMRKIMIIFLIMTISLSAFSQKVSISVVKQSKAADLRWHIMDSQHNPVFSDSEYYKVDSIPFSLEENKRFFLEISLLQAYKPDTIMLKLYINGEPILIIRSNIGQGDHLYPFFTGVPQKTAKIAGGSSTDISDFPWQVYFESGDYTCGGTIIGNRWILTAAHCTRDDSGNVIPASEMDVIVGANDPANGDGKKYYVSEAIVNENFDLNTLLNDIAILKLIDTINYTNAKPIKLISQQDANDGYTDPGVMSWVTGYGLTKVRPPVFPTTLQKVQLPIVSDAEADSVWSDIPATDLMAGYINGGKDACSGDSGGPLIVPYGGGYKEAGLVSWGSSNCNTIGAYTRISDFEQWITDKTGIEISYTPPVPSGDSIICQGVTSGTYSVEAIPDATAYEWQLVPSTAGTIAENAEQVTVTWNTSYFGAAAVKLRVTRDTSVSEWSALFVHLAKTTKITSQSADTVICAEQPISLDMNSDGYNLVYSWYKGSTLLKSGTSADVSLTTAAVSNTGVYTCNVSGSCGSDYSSPINLTVYPLTAITKVSQDSETAFGGNVTLSVSSQGHDLSFQWEKDKVALGDGNDSVFVMQNVTARNIGIYQVTVEGTCGTVTSDSIYVYVKKTDYTSEPEVFVWPTVTDNEFNVALSDDQTYNVRLYTITGKLMMEKTACQYQTTVSISDIPVGLYIVTIYNDKFRKSVKVLRN